MGFCYGFWEILVGKLIDGEEIRKRDCLRPVGFGGLLKMKGCLRPVGFGSGMLPHNGTKRDAYDQWEKHHRHKGITKRFNKLASCIK